jgi:microsomal dipeptidase-like Zn-dependent dipeptidase
MIRLILPVIALLHASTVRADLYDSDEELMRHLLSTDPILSRVSGECRDGRVGDTLPRGLKDVSDYPNLIGEMRRRGYSREDIEKVCSGNLLRVMARSEDIARRLSGRQ